MSKKALTNNPARRDALRLTLLQHFNAQYGAPSSGLTDLPELDRYSEDEIKLMLYSLDVAGLIQNVNGKSTSGAIYQTTKLGWKVVDITRSQRRCASRHDR